MPTLVPKNLTESTPKREVPSIQVKRLPSGLLPYRGLGPAEPEISYVPYSFGEIKRLAQDKVTAQERLQIYLAGIETNFPKTSLTYGDFLFIVLLRKISTLGAESFIAAVPCQHCGRPLSLRLRTDELEFVDIKVPDLPVRVKFSFGSHVFMPFTVQDYMKVVELKKEEDAAAILACTCTSMVWEKSYAAFDGCRGKDAELLNEVDRLLEHTLKAVTLTCTVTQDPADPTKKLGCGGNTVVELDGGSEVLLLPFRGQDQSFEDVISFGKTPAHIPAPSK